MLRSHCCKVGMLLLLTVILVDLAQTPVAFAGTGSGGGRIAAPGGPQYGAGGGGGGGTGCGDPDELGIYSRPAPPLPIVPAALSVAQTKSMGDESRSLEGPRIRFYLFLQRILGAVVR